MLQALQYIKRNMLHTQWVELWEAVKDTMDKALERSWVAVQAAKLSTSMWLESHEDYIDLVIPKESLTKCVRNTTTWSDVQEDLVEVCKTQCGRRIFSSKLGELTGAACSKQIADVINKMKGMARDTQAVIDGLVRRMEEMATNLGGISMRWAQIPRSPTFTAGSIARPRCPRCSRRPW